MPQYHFGREKEPTHPLLCRFKRLAQYQGFKKIYITVKTIEKLLELEKENDHEIVLPKPFNRPIQKTIKHTQIVRELTPIISKEAQADFFKVTVSKALFHVSRLLENLSPMPYHFEATVYTKHRASSSSKPRIILQLIIEGDMLTLQLAQLINGILARPGSFIYY